MQKLNISLLGLGLVCAIGASSNGCAPAKAIRSSIENSSETEAGSSVLARPSSACFPGLSQQVCFNTVARAEIKDQPSLYRYPDPYTDPSFPKSFDKRIYRVPDRLLDLRAIGWRQILSEHFERFELMPDNISRGSYGLFSMVTLVKMEQLRAAIARPMTITSGYRSPGHNSKIDGAAKWSRHTYGDGIDFKVSGMSYKNLAQMCLKYGASYYQLYSDHIHCDWRNISNDPAFFPSANNLSLQHVHEMVQDEGRIVVRPQALGDDGSTLVLGTEVPQEDEGELLHEWSIVNPRGEVVQSEEASPRVQKMSGVYQIRVEVGGSVVLQQEMTID